MYICTHLNLYNLYIYIYAWTWQVFFHELPFYPEKIFTYPIFIVLSVIHCHEIPILLFQLCQLYVSYILSSPIKPLIPIISPMKYWPFTISEGWNTFLHFLSFLLQVYLGWYALKKSMDITAVSLWGLISAALLVYDGLGALTAPWRGMRTGGVVGGPWGWLIMG